MYYWTRMQARLCGFHIANFAAKSHLDKEQDRSSAIDKSDLVLCAPVESAKGLDEFLNHYRKLGVDHFILVLRSDKSQSEAVLSLCKGHTDISVWSSRSASATNDVNALLHNYARGHWVICVNTCERLIYPKYESRPLHTLVKHLIDIDKVSMFCLLLHTYSSESEAHDSCNLFAPKQGDNVYFDGLGYFQEENHKKKVVVKGGAAARLNDENLKHSDLARISLVKWSRQSFFIEFGKTLYPYKLNRAHAEIVEITGCLINHCGFHNHGKAFEKGASDSSPLSQSAHLIPHSVKYTGSDAIIEQGLMNEGSWF